MKPIVPALFMSAMIASPALCETTSSAYGSASIFIQAYDVDTFDEVLLDISGTSSVNASAFVNARNGISSDTDTASVTFTNPTGNALELYVEYMIESSASTEFLDGVIITDARYDSNAYVELGFQSAFTSTNGGYDCDNADYSSIDFNCFGVFADDYEDAFDTPVQYLDPFASITFDMSASAFAFIESTVAPVPLPAGVALLLSGFGLLGVQRLRKRNQR